MKNLLKTIILILAISLNANQIDRFKLDVGVKKNIFIPTSFKQGSITYISNLKANISKTKEFYNKEDFRIFSEMLFKFSDSINSPKAFIIKFSDKEETTTIKCIKEETLILLKEEEQCAIKKQLESSVIEYERQHFYMNCIKEVFSHK